MEEDEDDEFGDDDWAIGDDDEEEEEQNYDDDGGEEEDEFGEYDRAEQAKRKKSAEREEAKGRKDGEMSGNKRPKEPRVRVRRQTDFTFEYFAGHFLLYFISTFMGLP